MNDDSIKPNTKTPIAVSQAVMILCGLWVIGAQVCSAYARGSADTVCLLTILGIAALVAAGVLRVHTKIARPAMLAIGLLSIAFAWLVYGSGEQKWSAAYATSAMLHHYGADPFRLDDQEMIQEKLRTGQINWLEMQRTELQIKQNPPSRGELTLFKARRFLRQTFWPPLQYQMWKKNAASKEKWL